MVVDRLKKGVCARTGERLSAAECGRPFSFLVAPEWAACRLDLGPRTPRLCLVCGTGEAACRIRSRSCAQSLTLFFFLCVRALLWRRPRRFFFFEKRKPPRPTKPKAGVRALCLFLGKRLSWPRGATADQGEKAHAAHAIWLRFALACPCARASTVPRSRIATHATM
ncbi:hypothetical protein [Pandoravirus japonicus]|uniref:Uncharacterized protein n=1 Tax=Pandoravirus japonicus TaxID=2823154 RepID=A0A811BN76_9VIRU|nr:hypothetical protein [Pandoravirus japonicus]